MRLYYYIFFRCYSIVSHFERDVPQWYAAAEVTIIDALLTASLFYYFLPGWWEQSFGLSSNWFFNAGVTLLFFAPNYFVFIYRDKFRDIVKSFEGESKMVEIVGGILTVVFILMLVWITIALQGRNIGTG